MINNYTNLGNAFNLIEVGCFNTHDARVICQNFKRNGQNITKYVGMDINKSGLIAGACLYDSTPWVNCFELVYGNAEVYENFLLPPVDEIKSQKKIIFCNKLVSAVPPNEGTTLLCNLARYMNARDYALINFTVEDSISKRFIKRIQKNPNSKFRVQKDLSGVSIYKRSGSHVQRIIKPANLYKLLKSINLAPIKIITVNELKESFSSPDIEDGHIQDGYNREFLLLAVKEENMKYFGVDNGYDK
jgi:hypothetical protein